MEFLRHRYKILRKDGSVAVRKFSKNGRKILEKEDVKV